MGTPGLSGKIQASPAIHELIETEVIRAFRVFTEANEVDEMETWFLEGVHHELSYPSKSSSSQGTDHTGPVAKVIRL